MHILLVRLRLIGDVVLTTPLIRALRRTFPDARLTYVAEPLAAPIVAANPHLDAVIVAERVRGLARFATDAGVVGRLRQSNVDVAIDLHGGPRAAWLARLSGAPVRIGYDIQGGWRYTRRVERPREITRRHSVENQWDLIASLDPALARRPTPDADPVEMRLDPAADERVRARLDTAMAGTGPVIVAHITAGNAFRQWPETAFAESLTALAAVDRDRRIILTAAGVDAPTASRIAQDVAARLGDHGRVSVMADLTLPELQALIGRAALFIGNDSGPMHVAATTATPIVAIFGPTLPATWAPWRPSMFVTEMVEPGPLRCRPCAQRVCEPGDFRCLGALPARQVIDAAERALVRGRDQRPRAAASDST